MGKTTHFGKAFHEYDSTSGSDPAYATKRTKPKPAKPKTKKSVKPEYLGDEPKPNLKGQTTVKDTKKTKGFKEYGGVAGSLQDRQRKQAERISKMFKKGGD